MCEKVIYFKIIYLKNENVYVEGYVEIPKNIEDSEDWYFTDRNGFYQYQQQFIHHDEIQLKKNYEQIEEIEKFQLLINSEYVDYVNDVILNSEEDENSAYIKDDIKIIINEGAKFENDDVELKRLDLIE